MQLVATSGGQRQAIITGDSPPVEVPQPKRARDTIRPEWGVRAPVGVPDGR